MKRILTFLLTAIAIALPAARAGNTFREGDVLEMRLSGPPEEFTKEFNVVLTVDEGKVNQPLIGRISAAGMTSTQLASSIEQRLKQAKLFTVANVNITPTSAKSLME
ncbi:MAG: polysaccharide biosynthesis/export family protein [Verrucomicrobiota bacterium]